LFLSDGAPAQKIPDSVTSSVGAKVSYFSTASCALPHPKSLVRVLFFEVKGTHKQFVVKGKPAVCKFVLERLTGDDSSDGMYKILHEYQRANLVDVIMMKSESIKDNSNFSIPHKYHISWKSYLQDLLSEPNTHDITFAGQNYEKTKYWFFYSFEKGLKLKVHISGKPSFVAASINHLSIFGHRIIKFLD
jgi:hypothetical protein